MKSVFVTPLRASFVLALTAALLAACGGRAAPPPCPDVRILAATSDLVQFRPGAGRDLTDVEYEVGTENMSGSCSYRRDGTQVEVDLTVTFVVERGPALQGNTVRFPYFVAIVSRDERILAKEVFDVELTFQQGQRRIGVTETSRERIPLAEGEIGLDYQILVGLQLTEEQLAFNRRERGF